MALGVAAGVTQISGAVPQAWAAPAKGEMPYRVLGSTGEKVSMERFDSTARNPQWLG